MRLEYLCILSFTVLSCTTLQPGATSSEPVALAPTPIYINPNESQTIEYIGTTLPPAGSVLGYHHDGLLKVHQFTNSLTPNLIEIWRGWLLSRGQQILKTTGYDVTDNSSAFGRFKDTSNAAFALAGTITYLSFDTYAPLAGGFTHAGMTIKWELFDIVKGKVVYSVDSNAEAQPTGVSGDAVVAAFSDCLSRLLSDRNFVSLLLEPVTSTPTPAGNWTTPLPDMSQIIEVPIASTLPENDWLNLVSRDSVLILSGDKGFGTAFVISASGFILTNYHVIEGQSRLEGKFPDGRLVNVRVIRTSLTDDVALLQIDVTGRSPIPIDTSASYSPGAEVIAIGNPLGPGLSFSITKGIVSGVRFAAGRTLIQTDVAINPGNSGGPLIDNKSGKVIGIVSAKLVGTQVEGIAFAIDIRDALRVLGISLK